MSVSERSEVLAEEFMKGKVLWDVNRADWYIVIVVEYSSLSDPC
jgi:hypothetical protein